MRFERWLWLETGGTSVQDCFQRSRWSAFNVLRIPAASALNAACSASGTDAGRVADF